MALREYRPLTRETDVTTSSEFRVVYYIICEGLNTEMIYFRGVSNNTKALGIDNTVCIIPLEKTEEHSSWSDPIKLIELADNYRTRLKEDPNSTYNDEDRFVIVFDIDIFNRGKKSRLEDILKTKKDDEIFVLSSPCFDLWLLLHQSGSLEEHILPNEPTILKNRKVSNKHTQTSKMASDILGFNTKGTYEFGVLLPNIDIAIEQEKKICQEMNEMTCKIGSNVGMFITEMRQKKFD